MRSAQEASCPSCGDAAVKVFSPVGVAFKGTGFHNTDYRKKPVDTTADAPKAEPSCPAATAGSAPCAGCPAATE